MTGHSARPGPSGALALSAALWVSVLLAGCAATANGSSPTSSAAVAQPGSSTPPRSVMTSRATPAHVRARDARAIRALIRAHRPGSISVAALDLNTGRRFSAGAAAGMWTASAYKLFVLQTLLMRRQSQGSTGLSAHELDLATRMIENSDNVAGYELWEDAGANPGLTSTAYRLGMGSTVPGINDPAFTTTSAPDCLRALQALVDADGPLNAASRAFVLHLMANVESDQRWGVGAAADPGSVLYTKNGWLSIDDSNGPGEDDDDLWAVTSLGIIRRAGDRVLMAVLTRHNPSFADGVNLVEALARPLAGSVTG